MDRTSDLLHLSLESLDCFDEFSIACHGRNVPAGVKLLSEDSCLVAGLPIPVEDELPDFSITSICLRNVPYLLFEKATEWVSRNRNTW